MADSPRIAGRPVRRGLVIAALSLGSAVTIATLAWRAGILQPSTVAVTSSPVPSPTAAPTVAPTAPASPTVAPTLPPATPEPTAALVAAPLTGLLVTPEAALQHPIVVMVDDHPDARPQSGFNAASIVWHAPAEGGTPRYMLVFQEQVAGSVGPVRSARQYFIEWASEYHAVYVHHGGSPQAKATLAAKGYGQWVYNADGFRWSPRYLWRITERYAPHNVYSDGKHLRTLSTKVGAEDERIKRVWTFGHDLIRKLRPIGASIKVTFPYGVFTYRYDAATNTYLRFIGSEKRPQVDPGDGKVVAPKNVVVLRMAFGPLNDGHPEYHRLEAHNVGEGTAYISTNGITVKGTWKKASQTAPTLLFGPDGKKITLTAGQTFIEVIGLTYGLKIVDGDAPEFVIPPRAADPR